MRRVFTIECDRVECSGKPLCGLPLRYIVKSPVRALWTAFSSEHARWVLPVTLQWKNTRRIGEKSRSVLLHLPAKDITPVTETRKNHLTYTGT